MIEKLVVTDVPAVVDWLRKHQHIDQYVKVIPRASYEDVVHKVVYAVNIPMPLASAAAEVRLLEVSEPITLDDSLTVEKLQQAGARISNYVVIRRRRS